jgi:UDP-glucose 4-epimerase
VHALVTGGAGFLGAKLVERLIAEGHEVDVLDDLSTGSLANLAAARAEGRGRLRIHQGDATAPAAAGLVARRRPDVVFHLVDRPPASAEAGDGPADPVADVALTVGSALRMVDGALRGGVAKLVHVLDASALYGAADPSSFPLRESEPPAPVDHHGVATWSVVEHLRVARRSGGLEFTSLAMATLYGPGDRHGPVAVALGAAASAGQPVDAGGRGLDLLYVDDAVDAVVRAADRGGGLLVNVGSGRSVGPAQLAALVAGREEPPAAGARRAARGFALDPGRARLHLGWAPWTGLAEGLRATRAWLDRP